MNTKEAIAHLGKQGFKVYKKENNLFSVWRDRWHQGNFTGRQLIKYAKVFSANNPQNTKLRSLVKEAYRRNNRSSLRHNLAQQKYDNLSQKERKEAYSDFWDYD